MGKMEMKKFSKMHFMALPFCLLGFIFLIVGLLSNDWVSVKKCQIRQTPTGPKTEYSAKYSHGLWNKCVGGECTNIMDSPPEIGKKDTVCDGRMNNWYQEGDCAKGVKCVNNVAVETITCSSTNYFDLKTRKCVSSNPNCGTCSDWQCRPVTRSSSKDFVLRDANNKEDKTCKITSQCLKDSANKKRYTEVTYGSTEWWDVAAQKKVTVKPSSCWDPECVVGGKGDVPDNKVVQTDGAVCEAAYICSGGKKTTKTCLAGETVALTSGLGIIAGQCITIAQFLQQPVADRSTCQNPKCKPFPNSGGLLNALNTDCVDYYQCSSSKMLSTKSCGATQYFDKQSPGSCVSTKPAGCKAYQCRSRVDGYENTDGTTCKAWSRCYNNGLSHETGTCPTGLLVLATASTVTSDGTRCSTNKRIGCVDTLCSGKSAGDHADSATTADKTCKKYFGCRAGGVLDKLPATCTGKNVLFPPSGGSCKLETTSGSTSCFDPRCTDLDATHTLTKYSYTSPAPDAKSRIDCRSYYKCEKGHFTTQSCSNANDYYDLAQAKCVSTRPTTCRDYTCWNRADGNWRTSDSNCNTYYTCLNGVKTTTSDLTCPTGQSLQGGISTSPTVAGVCKDHKAFTIPGCSPPVTTAPATIPPGVDGSWGPWSLWSSCNREAALTDSKSRTGISLRARMCDCPAKSGSGKTCPGDNYEISLCYTCAPEIPSFASGREGMIVAVIFSILALLNCIGMQMTQRNEDAHTIIMMSLVAAIAGIVGAVMFNADKPKIDCTVDVGVGFILAIVGAVCHIIAIIVCIIVCVMTMKMAKVGCEKTKVEKMECEEKKKKMSECKKEKEMEEGESNTGVKQEEAVAVEHSGETPIMEE